MDKGMTLYPKGLRSPLCNAKLDVTPGLEVLKQPFNGNISDIYNVIIDMTWKCWYIV